MRVRCEVGRNRGIKDSRPLQILYEYFSILIPPSILFLPLVYSYCLCATYQNKNSFVCRSFLRLWEKTSISTKKLIYWLLFLILFRYFSYLYQYCFGSLLLSWHNLRLYLNIPERSVEILSLNLCQVNLLNPTGHVMHQQSNIQQLYALPTPYLCVLYLSENKQRLVPLTA